MPVNLNKINRIYFIGIKGVAMSGLAVICKQMGKEVFGSDVSEHFITDKTLAENGIDVFEGFKSENLDCQPDLVVVGTSWGQENPEVAWARERGLLMIADSEMRGLLSLTKKTIAVTGVHGKTTTSALISFLFFQAGLKPSFLVGTGTVPDLGANAGWFEGKHFIVEGDEYAKSKTDKTPKFLDLNSAISVITSLEWEHVDVFRDLEIMEKYFTELVEKTKDLVVACGDWPSVKKVISYGREKTLTYGLSIDNDYQAYDIRPQPEQTLFKVRQGEVELGEFSIKLFGEHNVLNSLVAIIVGLNQGIALGKIKEILPKFSGTQRRFEVQEKNGITFVDDYAHHPTEIMATLKAIKSRYPGKNIICVFQPHTVSRTVALLNDFTRSFIDANQVFLVDIFASAREQSSDFTSKNLAEQTAKNHPNSKYAGSIDEVIDSLKGRLGREDVLVTMGAGDVYRVRDELIKDL